jgi:predicted murein hydrolase (TIGR00659 family)
MLLHPLLTSLVVIIVAIKTAEIPYAEYAEATKIIDFMLGISVVALGYLLYEQLTHVKGNITAMLTAIFVGSVVGIVSVILIARALGADPRIVASLEPKSITTPIAVTVCAHSGGIPSLTAIIVILVGIFGGVIGPFVLKKLGVESKLAQGLALGSAAHAVGTARAMELGAVEGAISGLAIGLMGVMTAILVPVIEAIMRFLE